MTVLVIGAVGVTPVGAFQGPFSGTVLAGTDGTFAIDPRDQNDALKAGYIPVRRNTWAYVPEPTAVLIATAGYIVASAALANGSLTIAHQPDTIRQVALRVDPGTSAITAGTMTVAYVANDGSNPQTDVLSLVATASTPFTSFLSKGVMTLQTPVIAGLVGGTSPKIQLDVNAALAVPVPPGSVDVTILKEVLDTANVATLGTLTNPGIWTPNTAPNSTHTYGVAYTTISP
jgi:hypothetical protein